MQQRHKEELDAAIDARYGPPPREKAVRGLGTTFSPEYKVMQALYPNDGFYLTETSLMRRTGLSIGGIQTGIRRLQEKDFIYIRPGGRRQGPKAYLLSEEGTNHFEMILGEGV